MPFDTMTWGAFFFVVGVVASLGGVYSYVRVTKRKGDPSKAAPLVEVEMSK
jgi:hypothetical protein